jgi:hypothetical protein
VTEHPEMWTLEVQKVQHTTDERPVSERVLLY